MENKIPTIKEIAKRLNISVSSVSRALHNHKSIGLRTKMQVHKLAEELHYQPNQTAILFKQRKTFTIGVVLPNLHEEFFSLAISGIEDLAMNNKYNVLIAQSHDKVEREQQIVQTMKNNRVDGLIVSLSKQTYNYDHFKAFEEYNIPVVFFDRVPHLPGFHKVYSNMNDGTKQAVEFLFSKGHRIIGVLNGPERMKSCKERIEAYQNVLQKKRIKIDMSLIAQTDLTQESTFAAMEYLLSLKRNPTAILAINDYAALDAMKFAKLKGIRINKDICFVSYANLPITQYLETPPMASVEQFPYKQAERATQILLELLNKKDVNKNEAVFYNEVLDCKLVLN